MCDYCGYHCSVCSIVCNKHSLGVRRFVAKFMAMSMDEKAAQLISRAVEGRLLLWPDRKSTAAQDSSFSPIHAHLIRVSISVALLTRGAAGLCCAVMLSTVVLQCLNPKSEMKKCGRSRAL